ncbi:hypothetical protein GMD78_05460 [Ornithinibacillus sp. L9]|uniref:Uncharacterized protein n=1 Tax=Ornithinibacillus caprae TaxID=2678566 RepID=A0A6N8FGN2_9BACI|nr:hypothetical protein [Ornithinibacillus caprae]MUK87846.1 hypothetical protein [Ornithinibacillus caprae]
MIGSIGGITEIIISILVFVLLIIGLWFCKIYSFKAGIYFFLLILIHKIYSFVAPPLVGRYIDWLGDENKNLWFDMTTAELVVLFSIIPNILELVAFTFLIIGFYRYLNRRVC